MDEGLPFPSSQDQELKTTWQLKKNSIKDIFKNYEVYETSVKFFAYFHSRHGAGNSSSLLTFTRKAQSRATAVKVSMKRFL